MIILIIQMTLHNDSTILVRDTDEELGLMTGDTYLRGSPACAGLNVGNRMY